MPPDGGTRRIVSDEDLGQSCGRHIEELGGTVPDLRQPVRDRWTRGNGRRLERVLDTEMADQPTGYLAVHTHFIELQPSHALEEFPFLVLVKQRRNVTEACRLLNDAAHPAHSTNLRSGSVWRSC